jgi:hypothetical protein
MLLRVTIGAGSSMIDLGTDVYVTYMFWRDSKYGYFRASLASLLMSLGLQLFAVFLQNKKLGKKRILQELLPILVGFKPAVDAYRVSKSEKQKVGATVDVMTELTFIKVIEMFAEAIPGVIIQLMAIATASEEEVISTMAWLSLAVSALSTGFASASISYDWDTDPEKRENIPSFYGYVPANATKRSIVFLAMVVVTSCMLMIRCLIIVLLGLSEPRYVVIYIGADLGLYLSIKILREDFYYWMPFGGKLEIFLSILARVGVKIVTDFTSIMQFRHPNEVGGMYWLFGFVLTMISLPLAINVASGQDNTEQAVVLASQVGPYIVLLNLIGIGSFFAHIDRSYMPTFYSIDRCKDLCFDKFHNSISDAAKADTVFNTSRHVWRSFEEEVRTWVEENWERWEDDNPKWLNVIIRQRIPIEFIPNAAARKRESIRRDSVKRKSILNKKKVKPVNGENNKTNRLSSRRRGFTLNSSEPNRDKET